MSQAGSATYAGQSGSPFFPVDVGEGRFRMRCNVLLNVDLGNSIISGDFDNFQAWDANAENLDLTENPDLGLLIRQADLMPDGFKSVLVYDPDSCSSVGSYAEDLSGQSFVEETFYGPAA